jgi:hypothetical protein
MREGRSVRLAALAEIDKRIPDALVKHAVDAPLRPYFEVLRSRSVAGSVMAGFKFIREDEEQSADVTEEQSPAEEATEEAEAEMPEAPDEKDGEEEKQPLFFWFFFPLAEKNGRHANVVAWEASTGTGRATYFFRATRPEEAGALADPVRAGSMVEEAVARLTRGLALVNFRREPVYLPDESLERQPRFHKYAIGCRKLPDLRSLRGAMLGRAIHSTPENWGAQVETITRGK